MTPTNLPADKNIVMVIAFRGFQDLEYTKTRETLEKAGFKITVASSMLGTATGKFDQRVDVDLTIDEINVDDYEAIVWIGGPGANEYFENQTAHQLIKKAVETNRVLAAICIAPEILAKAGVLAGKKATVWSSVDDQGPLGVLKENGAQYLDQELVMDGKIITANGPNAAEQFGKAIVDQSNI